MRAVLLTILLVATPLCANEVGVAAPDAESGWLLLENPPGIATAATSELAGDPGLPVPDASGWPHNGAQDGGWPTCELWHYDARTQRYTRVTRVLGKGDEGKTRWRRTLTNVFEINGVPYVLHYDPMQTLKGYSQVLRADNLANAGGAVPTASIMLNSAEYLDAPAVSPDRKHVVFRCFRRQGSGFVAGLRVYSVANWAVVADSGDLHAGRPVWLKSDTLALVAYDNAIPRPLQHEMSRPMQVRESHEPATGRLLTLTLPKLKATELLKGSFPPDRITPTLLADPLGFGLLLARAEGAGVVVEMRGIDGRTAELARFETFRGMCVMPGLVRMAGVRRVGGYPVLVVARCERWTELRTPFGPMILPFGDKRRVTEDAIDVLSRDAHGGMLDLGRGVCAFLEPVVNPDFDPSRPATTALLRHALWVFDWRGCDSLRNPRQIARLSLMVRRFEEVAALYSGGIPSTQMIYDVSITDGKNDKKGRYVELYASHGRGGKGRIRTEDNLSGDWLVQSIDDPGGGDVYYDCADVRQGQMRARRGDSVGKSFDDLLVQLETRKLLTLTGVERKLEDGGLHFRGRDVYRDPHSGAVWRVWVYERYGRKLADGTSERVELRFVAGLPVGTAGDWRFPHALARARVKFALAGNKDAAITDLAFKPDKFIELPNLTDLGNPRLKPRPSLFVPAEFGIFEDQNGKPVKRLEARAVQPGKDGIEHPEQIVKGGRIRPGYEVPLLNDDPRRFRELQR